MVMIVMWINYSVAVVTSISYLRMLSSSPNYAYPLVFEKLKFALE